jgi:hypothetical protein
MAPAPRIANSYSVDAFMRETPAARRRPSKRLGDVLHEPAVWLHRRWVAPAHLAVAADEKLLEVPADVVLDAVPAAVR